MDIGPSKGLNSMAIVVFVFCFPLLTLLFVQIAHPASAHEPTVRVPFVGCKSDGQVGASEAPVGQDTPVSISEDSARRLAYYETHGVGVLAARGWYCAGTYGSNGANLYVAPEPISAAQLLSPDWKGFAGPAIQLSTQSGDTSGRFAVARVIARVFPAYSTFVRDVIAEGIEPASAFPSGPFPTDKLTYRSKAMVEFQTPAQKDGLGTMSRMRKADAPIYGVAILFGETPDLMLLSTRLTPQTADLSEAIIRQTECEVARKDTRNNGLK